MVTDENLAASAAFAKELAKKTGAIIAITGAIDIVANDERAFAIRNGNAIMGKITGAGCMLTVLCGAFAAVQPQAPLQAAVQAAEFWKACAAAAEPQAHGPASFRVALLDAAAQIV